MVKHMTRAVMAGWLVLLFVATGTQQAHAQSTRVSEPDVVVVQGGAARLRVNVHPANPTVLRFQSRIIGTDRMEWQSFVMLKEPGEEVLVLHPELDRPGSWGKIHVRTRDYSIMLDIVGVSAPKQAHDIIEVRHQSAATALDQAARAQVAAATNACKRENDVLHTEIETLLAEKQKHLARLQQQAMAVDTRGREHHVLTEMLRARSELPPREVADDDRPVVVRGLTWQVVGTLHVLVLDLKNNESLDFHIGNLQLFDGANDRTGEVQIEGASELPTQTSAASVQGIIPAGKLVRAAMSVRDPQAVGEHLTLSIRDSNGKRPPILEPIPTFRFTEPKPENEGKMTLSVQGIYGAIWLADGVRNTMSPKLDATSLKGLGIRLTYGLTARLSFEAEVMGAASGEAEFKSFTWDEPGGMTRTADLYRSAALGRVQGGLMMRFGDDVFRPLVRLGLGLQGAGQAAEMAGADGMRTEGPEVPFEFGLIANIGAGLDVLLGDQFLLGFGFSYFEPLKSTSRSLDFGLHLAYAWKP